MLIAVLWIARAVILVWLAVRRSTHSGNRVARLAAWTVVPLCGLVGVAALASDRDLRLRFRLSEPPLTRYAESVLASGPTATAAPQRWVGLFQVQSVTVNGGAVRLTTSYDVIDPCGLLYAPAGQPAPEWGEDIRHLRGPWYVFRTH